MLKNFGKHLLVSLLLLSIIAPKASAVLAEVIPGFQTMIICTGSELITLQIDPNGNPVETETAESEYCAFGESVKLEVRDDRLWVLIALEYQVAFSNVPSKRTRLPLQTIKAPSQAPPFLV